MKTVIIDKQANLRELVQACKDTIIEASINPRLIEASQNLKSLEDIYNYAENLISYKKDPDNRQIIKRINTIYRDKIGNCFQYCTIIGGLLSIKNIPFKICVGDYGKGFEHIYIKSGDTIIDPTPQGKEKNVFNREYPYINRKCFNMAQLEVLQGVNNISGKNNYGRIAMRRKMIQQSQKPFQGTILGDILRAPGRALEWQWENVAEPLINTTIGVGTQLISGAGMGAYSLLSNPQSLASIGASAAMGNPAGLLGLGSGLGGEKQLYGGGGYYPMQQPQENNFQKYLPWMLAGIAGIALIVVLSS